MSWNLKEQSLGTYVVGASLGTNTSVSAGSATPKNHWASDAPGAYIGVPWYAVLSF